MLDGSTVPVDAIQTCAAAICDEAAIQATRNRAISPHLAKPRGIFICFSPSVGLSSGGPETLDGSKAGRLMRKTVWRRFTQIRSDSGADMNLLSSSKEAQEI